MDAAQTRNLRHLYIFVRGVQFIPLDSSVEIRDAVMGAQIWMVLRTFFSDSHVRQDAVERGGSSVTQVTFTTAVFLLQRISSWEDPVYGPVDWLQREVCPKEMSLHTYTHAAHGVSTHWNT